MKISFTGSYSTGKTTSLEYFRSLHKIADSYFIEEVAKGIIKRGFPVGKNTTSATYFNLIRDQLPVIVCRNLAEFRLSFG